MYPSKARFWCLALVVCLFLSTALMPNNLQAAQPNDPQIETARNDQTIDRYIIQLQGDPLALFASRSKLTQKESAKPDFAHPTVQTYKNQLTAQRSNTISSIQQELGRNAQLLYVYDTAFHGVVIEASAAEMRRIGKLNGVISYEKEASYELLTDFGPSLIGANSIQDGSATGVYAATLLGANLTPSVSSSLQGRGTFSFDSTSKALSYTVNLNGPSTGVTIINSDDKSLIANLQLGGGNTYAGSVTLTAQQESWLTSGKLFVVAKTASNPSGEAGSLISGYKGEGVVVGIIDSGINMGHPSFAAVGGDGYRHINPLGQGVYLGACDPSNPFHKPEIVCNDKLIGAWTFEATSVIANTDTGAPSPHDEDGHGSHTASTVAGNVLTNISLNGAIVPQISGVAPHANIIAYDACGYISAGVYTPNCTGSALLAAANQAVADGVDVINYSISGGVNPWQDSVELAFLNARAANIVVSTSAGNSGPSASSVNHLSPWLLSVAATSHGRLATNQLQTITDGVSTYPEGDISGLGLTGSIITPT